LLAPSSGELVAGETLRDGAGPSPQGWRSRQLLDRIGTVFQSPEHQFLAPTVRQELEIGPRALGTDPQTTARIAEEFAERLGLTHLLRAHPFSLSGGEKRRLSVATVLTASPRLIVLDEPTFGQDARTWNELVVLLREQLANGRSIVAVTHDREVVDALCDVELRLPAPTDASGGLR
jgi:energy-coupling factor transport system ATP-binding protein